MDPDHFFMSGEASGSDVSEAGEQIEQGDTELTISLTTDGQACEFVGNPLVIVKAEF